MASRKGKKPGTSLNPAEQQLQNMLLTFRVSELQMLLGFTGQNKTGRKQELQDRAKALLKGKGYQNQQIANKIRELYKSIQLPKGRVHRGLNHLASEVPLLPHT